MPSILFVCTANQFRSPLATACFSRLIEQEQNDSKKWLVESAGTWAEDGVPAPAITLQVAGSLGLPGLDRHLTRQVELHLLERFDLILVMEAGQKEALCTEFPSICRRAYLLSEIVDSISYDIPDPDDAELTPADAGAILFDLLARGKEKILQLAESLSS
jgi:protein-tyrosine phosphatase